jgi:hypothetical protein
MPVPMTLASGIVDSPSGLEVQGESRPKLPSLKRGALPEPVGIDPELTLGVHKEDTIVESAMLFRRARFSFLKERCLWPGFDSGGTSGATKGAGAAFFLSTLRLVEMHHLTQSASVTRKANDATTAPMMTAGFRSPAIASCMSSVAFPLIS